MLSRSLLYVPGNKPAMFDKALASGADAVILDLEDAVPFDLKSQARAAVSEWLASYVLQRTEQVAVHVRINSGALMGDDVAAIHAALPDGIYVPKVSSPTEIDTLGDLDVRVTALIETAAGVLDARSIAEHPRVTRLAIGEADLGGELSITPGDDGSEMLPMRAMVVLASAAAHIEPPVGPVSTDFKDLDALRMSTEAIKRMGFAGRAAIHPAQVGVINAVFTPTTEEAEAAEKLLVRFAEAGGGVCVDDQGRMVDEATVRTARTTLGRRRDPRS